MALGAWVRCASGAEVKTCRSNSIPAMMPPESLEPFSLTALTAEYGKLEFSEQPRPRGPDTTDRASPQVREFHAAKDLRSVSQSGLVSRAFQSDICREPRPAVTGSCPRSFRSPIFAPQLESPAREFFRHPCRRLPQAIFGWFLRLEDPRTQSGEAKMTMPKKQKTKRRNLCLETWALSGVLWNSPRLLKPSWLQQFLRLLAPGWCWRTQNREERTPLLEQVLPIFWKPTSVAITL